MMKMEMGVCTLFNYKSLSSRRSSPSEDWIYICAHVCVCVLLICTIKYKRDAKASYNMRDYDFFFSMVPSLLTSKSG